MEVNRLAASGDESRGSGSGNAAPSASAAGIIPCGNARCSARQEVCCGFSSDNGCARKVPPEPGGDPAQRYQAQIARCEQSVQSEYSFDSLRLCDDSSDCPARHVCCHQLLWGGASLEECLPFEADGSNPCDYGESCVEGEPCVTIGTTCILGKCMVSRATVNCAGVECQRDSKLCCGPPGEEPKCVERSKCSAAGKSSLTLHECSGPSSCPPGDHCQRSVGGSACARSVDIANAVVLCEGNGDCPKDLCHFAPHPGAPSCKTDPEGGPSHCDCP